MKNFLNISILLSLAAFLFGCETSENAPSPKPSNFVRVSKENPRYFEFADGTPYIPIGMNLCFPRPYFFEGIEDEGFAKLESGMAELSKNGGNFVRVWVGADFFNIENEAGKFDPKKMARFDRYMKLAQKYNLRVKFCMQHFRSTAAAEPNTSEANKLKNQFRQPAYSPLFKNMTEYLSSDAGKKMFLDYTRQFADRYADNSHVFGVELWNEMNSVGAKIDLVEKWTIEMLPQVKRQFPNHLVMQSLGSFDSESGTRNYKRFMPMKDNDVAQAHRYLDCGAKFEICHGAVDVFCADAIETITAFAPGKPALLAESGAVNPKHTGPFNLYAKDSDGIILHDVLFAPFFSGSAGAGQPWHWEWYVGKNNLYRQFGRFAKAVEGINPIEENFAPSKFESDGCRFYVLTGNKTVIGWIRDAKSDWRSELERGEKPREIRGLKIKLSKFVGFKKIARISFYNPWTNVGGDLKIENGEAELPPFARSTIFKMELK